MLTKKSNKDAIEIDKERLGGEDLSSSDPAQPQFSKEETSKASQGPVAMVRTLKEQIWNVASGSPTHMDQTKLLETNDHDDEIMGDALVTPEPDPTSLVRKNTSKRELFKKINRMKHRDQRKPCMFYPEDPTKANWDLFITIVLIYTCIQTPQKIAFVDDETLGWTVALYSIDFLFFIDILVCFNSALQDDDFKTIDDRKVIACEYVSGWFFLDLFAILPLSDIMVAFSSSDGGTASPDNLNQMIRLAKIGRLYKLIKLTKLLRILKIVKEKSKLLKYVRNIVQLGYGFERLVFFVLIFLLISHIVACMWIFVAKFDNYEGTWMEGDTVDLDPLEQYLISFYFTVTTITTVGYGDISASSNGEKYFCILIMIIGVVSFSVLSGSLANIL